MADLRGVNEIKSDYLVCNPDREKASSECQRETQSNQRSTEQREPNKSQPGEFFPLQRFTGLSICVPRSGRCPNDAIFATRHTRRPNGLHTIWSGTLLRTLALSPAFRQAPRQGGDGNRQRAMVYVSQAIESGPADVARCELCSGLPNPSRGRGKPKARR